VTVRLIHGDCREILLTLPAESVHCVVTSPPYWGLRDYGTATWEGGDPGCDHAQKCNIGSSTLRNDGREHIGTQPYEKTAATVDCSKCGARRIDAQIGLERTPEDYVSTLVAVFREVRRVLAEDGTLWLNLGDSYNNRTRERASSHQPGLNGIVDEPWAERSARGGVRMSITSGGLKEKDLVGIPWRVALALQADGWYLRSDIILAKPNPMPESVRDRPTKSHEYLFLLSKSGRYYYDSEAIAEPATFDGPNAPDAIASPYGQGFTRRAKSGNKTRKPATERGCPQEGVAGSVPWEGSTRNKRSVWTVATAPFSDAHFATFPPPLIEPCILAGCPENGTVLDPFGGAGTTGLVADRLQRNAILIELNSDYNAMSERRITGDAPLFAEVNS